MRVVAVLATYNEELFIASCLEHLFRQGVEVYLIDNCSTDRTVEIAERYRGRGLIQVESHPRNGGFRWRSLLERKEQVAAHLEADWLMHVDADEAPLPPPASPTLAEAFAAVEAQGYNAVNFLEFTFIPTREAPDHEHLRFKETMRFYYPFMPGPAYLVRAWKRQPVAPELAWSGGHRVRFAGLRVWSAPFAMRHYLFLSVPHAVRKYVNRRFDPAELQAGWHGWRARLRPDLIRLPAEADLRPYRGDGELDASMPRTRHVLDESLEAAEPRGAR